MILALEKLGERMISSVFSDLSSKMRQNETAQSKQPIKSTIFMDENLYRHGVRVWCVLYVCVQACMLYVFIIQSHLGKFTYWGWLGLCIGISKSVYSEYKEEKEKELAKTKNWQQNSQEK